jgi:hypothetical protein
MVLPLIFFGFKVIKMFFLYRQRVAATLRQSIAASLAGLALSHVIARAMVTGLITRRIGFFRTPKQAGSNALLQALLNAREELLLLVAMSLGATGVLMRPDGVMLDTQLWALVLAVQAIPYCAAVLVSLVSGMPQLPSRLVGAMARLGAT